MSYEADKTGSLLVILTAYWLVIEFCFGYPVCAGRYCRLANEGGLRQHS